MASARKGRPAAFVLLASQLMMVTAYQAVFDVADAASSL